MIRINGTDFVGTVQYPVDRILVFIMTSQPIGEIVSQIDGATDISIVNDGEVIATYGCTFNGIERADGGYRIIFNRYPMSTKEVSELFEQMKQMQSSLDKLNEWRKEIDIWRGGF